MRPRGVVVSAHVSLRILKPAPRPAMAARTLSRPGQTVEAGGRQLVGSAHRTAIALRPKASQLYRFAPEITMPKVNLSRMTVEALMDLRSGLKKCFLSIGPRYKSSWRRWMPWLAAEGLFEVAEAF